ncbi:MAG: flagellar M-ring protein FliF [Firmicutes bacterium]|nr:flagellar M-ring protein FliF [Bacillota bacterium]HXL04554.1 flagellar basal-body MS-ring/collar protein FliF [Bacillota bacterium]
MASSEKDITGQRRSLWDRLSRRQIITLVMVAIVGISIMVFFLVRPRRDNMVLLYSDLSMTDAADIAASLKEMRIPYELSKGGTAILVSSQNLYEARMNLAREGLPRDSTVGFEIFDKTTFGLTDFTQKMNYRRALQGELTRTILQLNEIEAARVHIAIPEPELYTDKEKPPSASVLVKLKKGSVLTRGQVEGIVRLVASSVEGLSVDNITIVDVDGNTLFSGDDHSQTGSMTLLTLSQLEAKRLYEKDLEKSIESMLTQVFGPRKVVVRVNADIDFDHKEQNTETFQPLPSGYGVIREEARIRDVKTSTPSVSPGGIPGTRSNVDIGTSSSVGEEGVILGYRLDDSSGSGMSSEERTEEVAKYEISRTVEHTVKAPGVVTGLSVAAIVAAPVAEDRLEAIRRSIGAAVGINLDRGDSIIVEAMEFAVDEEKEEEDKLTPIMDEPEEPKRLAETVRKNLKYIIPAVLALFVLVIVLVILSSRRTRVADEQAAYALKQAMSALAAAEEGEDKTKPAEKAASERPPVNPEVAARIISTWLSENRG